MVESLIVSDSEVNTYATCPQRWHFRYVMGLKIAPEWAITGRAAHAAEETNYKQKMETERDLPLEDVKDIAATTFEAERQKEEVLWDDDSRPEKAKDRTILAVETYHLQVAPAVHPLMVEEKFELPLPSGATLRGRIDVVDQTTAIRDTKHVSYKPRQDEDRYQTQPGVYGWAYQRLTGRLPRFIFDYVVLGRKDTKRTDATVAQIETSITPTRVTQAVQRVQAVHRAIQAGIVYGNPSNWNCSGCGYRRICPWVQR